MSFSTMLEILKVKEEKKILFTQCGHFYLATGEDAVFLHEVLNLKCTCFRNNICKVGVPLESIEKYLGKLDKFKMAYAVYDYNRANNELIKKYLCGHIGYINIANVRNLVNKLFYIEN